MIIIDTLDLTPYLSFPKTDVQGETSNFILDIPTGPIVDLQTLALAYLSIKYY